MKDNHQPPSQENKYYQAVIHNSPAAIVVIDHDSHVSEWNPAAEKLFGYTREEALGKNIDDLIANDAIRSEANIYSEKTKSGESIRLTTTRIRKDGTPVEVEVQGVPIYAEDSAEVTDFMAIYHDISELQQEPTLRRPVRRRRWQVAVVPVLEKNQSMAPESPSWHPCRPSRGRRP